MRSPDAKGGELLPFWAVCFFTQLLESFTDQAEEATSRFRAGEKKTKGSFLLKKDPYNIFKWVFCIEYFGEAKSLWKSTNRRKNAD